MPRMFFNCSSLKELNLSRFNTDKVFNMSNIFTSINKYCKIKYSDERLLKEFKNETKCIII